MESHDELLAELAFAKTAEAKAKDNRIAIEEKILANFKLGEKERKTVKGSNGLTATLATGISYKLDKEYPDEMPVKTTVKLDETKYEKLRESDPDVFKVLSEYVTTKPKKASVTLKVG
jgi:hypothetical protein